MRKEEKYLSRPASGVSFSGFDSFDEVRRGFEFSDDRPTFYPPSAATRRLPHRRHESTLSTMSALVLKVIVAKLTTHLTP